MSSFKSPARLGTNDPPRGRGDAPSRMPDPTRHRLLARLRHVERQFARRLGTRSVLTLQLAGFALVALPLLSALIIAGGQIDRVTRESEQLLERTLSITRSARQIGERVVAFERAARQHRVLRDREALGSLLERHGSLIEGLEEFTTLATIDSLVRHADRLRAHSRTLFDQTLESQTGEDWPAALAEDFGRLGQRADTLLHDSEAVASRELERLARMGESARRFSYLSLGLTIPLAIILALLMASFLNRRVRQLDRGMRALARPEQARIEQITSPRDLRALSIRMEWVRRRLARTERDRRRLIGQVSHELKTPLSAIREGTSLLADQNFGTLGRKQREVIGIIQSGIERLQEQIENLLRFNRLQSGMQPRVHHQVRLDEIASQVLANYRLTLEARGLRVERHVPASVPIEGDPDMLATALDNLVSNALKFSPDGGTIGIDIRRDGDHGIVRVADGGPGIRARDREQLFEPFFRGDSSYTRERPGSGLGLAICRDLVRAHHGEVQLVEQAGWSTVFEVRIPLKQPTGPNS